MEEKGFVNMGNASPTASSGVAGHLFVYYMGERKADVRKLDPLTQIGKECGGSNSVCAHGREKDQCIPCKEFKK